MNDLIVPSVGMKVRVTTVDGSLDDGYECGEIVKVEPLWMTETGVVIDESHPTIRTENGVEVFGIECWWRPDDFCVDSHADAPDDDGGE